uniref:Uncharacterized protein n=1 Tax=Fagus sylvatica TaxID=28930 RepID=A0A2N9GNP2_FAGSY
MFKMKKFFVLSHFDFSGVSISGALFILSEPLLLRLFVRVCRVVEGEDRVLDFGELVPSDCVLRRLSEEFFGLVSPALDTGKIIRGLMVSGESSWHEVRSEELPEGLSDRDEDSRSQGEAPSVSDGYRRKYQIPEDVVLRIPESDEVACSSSCLDRLNLAPGQLAPNAWRTVVRIHGDVEGTPSSNREWKDNYVFVCGDNWEGLQCEKDDNFVPCSSRVGRALVLLHHYKHFVRPSLLARYSFGPEPSEDVMSLQGDQSKKGWRLQSLTREKLKKMMMSQQDEAPLKPSVPDPVPTSSVEVVEISAEPSSSRSLEKVPTLPRDASLACRRAKSVVTKDDVGEYDKVNTDVIKVAGIHSLMKGLTELTVIANRCTQWEEALLKQKIQMSEAAQANQRLTTLVNELTLDRDRVVGELSILKTDLARRDEELKKALDGARRSDEQVKTLASQLEGARVSAVEEFKSSEAYDDVNTKYFLSGFNLLKKQAKEKFPELDFDGFQPFR